MCEMLPPELTPEAEVDRYKKSLYEVRKRKCSREMLKLSEMLSYTKDEAQRKELLEKSEKLDKYYQRLQQKSESL